MPIDESLYHPNFKWQGPLCIEQANYTCKHCGGKRGDKYTTEAGETDTVTIQACHVNHDPWNSDPELIALCEACHNRYDMPMRTKNQKRTKRLNKYVKELEAGAQIMPLSWPERSKPARGRLAAEIRYNEDGSYSFSGKEDDRYVSKILFPDSTAYFAWLSSLDSFHFEGRNGSFTARKESRKNKGNTIRREMYWSAYKKNDHKQLRRYLGITGKLSVKTLEDAAKHIADRCAQQEPRAKKPRKRPVPRAELMARIEERDKTIRQLEARVRELEQGLGTHQTDQAV